MTSDGTEEQGWYETRRELVVRHCFRRSNGEMASKRLGTWRWGSWAIDEPCRWDWINAPDADGDPVEYTDADRCAIKAAEPDGDPVARLDVKP